MKSNSRRNSIPGRTSWNIVLGLVVLLTSAVAPPRAGAQETLGEVDSSFQFVDPGRDLEKQPILILDIIEGGEEIGEVQQEVIEMLDLVEPGSDLEGVGEIETGQSDGDSFSLRVQPDCIFTGETYNPREKCFAAVERSIMACETVAEVEQPGCVAAAEARQLFCESQPENAAAFFCPSNKNCLSKPCTLGSPCILGPTIRCTKGSACVSYYEGLACGEGCSCKTTQNFFGGGCSCECD